MMVIKKIIDTPYALWLLLVWPAVPLVWDFYEDLRHYPELMLITGLWSIQFLVVALAITPLGLLTKRWVMMRKVSRWLLVHRRYFGVASFGYALLHLLFYIRDIGSLLGVWLEVFDIPILVGWIGAFIMLALALTSNDLSIRLMGKGWKQLQRMAYLAAIAIFIHWYYFVDFPMGAFYLWLGIMIAAKLVHIVYRIWQWRNRSAIKA